MTIPANDLKIKGISAIDSLLNEQDEAIITMRGKHKYVVLDIDRYNYLRECELESALKDAQKELAEGKYIEESVEEHIKRIIDGI